MPTIKRLITEYEIETCPTKEQLLEDLKTKSEIVSLYETSPQTLDRWLRIYETEGKPHQSINWTKKVTVIQEDGTTIAFESLGRASASAALRIAKPTIQKYAISGKAYKGYNFQIGS